MGQLESIFDRDEEGQGEGEEQGGEGMTPPEQMQKAKERPKSLMVSCDQNFLLKLLRVHAVYTIHCSTID